MKLGAFLISLAIKDNSLDIKVNYTVQFTQEVKNESSYI